MLKEWSVNYEVLPTARAVELSSKIPLKDTISATCRPSGIEDTIVFTEAMTRPVSPNIAFGRFTSLEHFNAVSDRLVAARVTSIMGVRGDGKPSRTDLFPYALAGINAFWKRGVKFEYLVGGYPLEISATDKDPTWVLLQKQKFAKEHNIPMTIVTQFTPNESDVISWVERIRSEVELPVVVGIPGKLNAASMRNLISAVGFRDNLKLLVTKPKMVFQLLWMSIRGFDPAPYITKLAGMTKEEHKITGIRIFTLGNITASVARVGSL